MVNFGHWMNRLISMFSFLGGVPIIKGMVAPNYYFYVIMPDDTTIKAVGYNGGEFAFLPMTGQSYKKTDLSKTGELKMGELNAVFLERDEKKRVKFRPCEVKFHQTAIDEIKKVDEAKMLDRQAEKIWYSGEAKWKLPMSPENIIMIIAVGIILLIFFWVLITNFGSLVSPLAATKSAMAAEAVNQTAKPPFTG